MVGTTGARPDEPKKRPLRAAYLILGDDRPKVESALHRLRERIVEESGTELNIDEFVAAQHSAHEVVAAANTLAFLAGIRLVLVHGVEQWKKPDKEIIASYLRSPAPDSCLTLVGEKLTGSDPLRVAVAAAGDVLEYSAPRASELPGWAVRQAKKIGAHLEPGAARLLVQYVGDDQHVLMREVEKLAAYRGRAYIREEDVADLTPRAIEASIFDLVDAVATRRGAQVFSSIEALYASGERPTGLLFRVLRHFQHLSRAVAMREAGLAPAQVQAELKMKPFPARKIVEQSGAYDSTSIGRALGVLAETDARMKGKGDLPPEVEFELCLGMLMVGPRDTASRVY